MVGGQGKGTVGLPVLKKRFWRSLRPSRVSWTVTTGNPIFAVQLPINAPTSIPLASDMAFHKSLLVEQPCA
jgi:hypothetical protein